jgi:MFS family permease
MAKFAHFVLWVFILAAAATGIGVGYAVLKSSDLEPALKVITAECSAPMNGATCLDLLARLDRLRAMVMLTSAAVTLAGIGAAFGLELVVLSFDTANGSRSERDRRSMVTTGLIVISVSVGLLVAALIARFV